MKLTEQWVGESKSGRAWLVDAVGSWIRPSDSVCGCGLSGLKRVREQRESACLVLSFESKARAREE